MKTKIFIIIFAIISAIFVSDLAFAADCVIPEGEKTGTKDFTQMLKGCQTQGISVGDGYKAEDIKVHVTKISVQALGFAGLFAVGAIVWAGIQYTTAYGDSSKLESAKKTAIFAAVGLVVALISFSLVNAILYFMWRL